MSKAISKRIRFEVFKRDKFTCQYCGKSAPEVVLNVDHVKPRTAGGSNDMLNLVTSCAACNSGKSDKQLSDDSAVTKQRRQLQELEERRQQLSMMLDWQRSLMQMESEAVGQLVDLWAEAISEKFPLNNVGKKELGKLVTRFGVLSVFEAMRIAGNQYVVTDHASAEETFNKIGGICFNRKQQQKPPESAPSQEKSGCRTEATRSEKLSLHIA